VALVVLRQWLQTSRGRLAVDRFKLKLPFLGSIAHSFAVSEYCRALSTLVEGGLPLVPSLEIATQSVGNAYVRERLHPAIEMVQEGRPVNEALGSSDMLDHTAVDMVKVGETTGTLGTMLGNVSDFLDQEVETRLQRFLTLLEPAMLVIMGVVIGLLLVSVYLPMFSILGQIQG
jgi:type IV pilus assembly protein PilC